MPRVTVRYWASLRSAAGRNEDVVEATTLADALAAARIAHAASARFGAVLDVCAIVVDGTPAGRRDRAQIALADGSVVELLPPFAGG
jgi:molybdopterin synthase sulfur carrier subunit